MFRMPFFSIVTVCKNEELRIKKTIESVRNQNCENYEYIIMDGISSDGTADIIKSYMNGWSNLKLMSQYDDGIYDAMNNALKHCNGRYVFFLNAGDTFYSYDVLDKVLNDIGEREIDVYVGGINEIFHNKKVMVFPKNAEHTFLSGVGYPHQSIFAKRELIEEGFDCSYRIYADYEWECKVFASKAQYYLGNVVISNYDMYGISAKIINSKRRWDELFTIWKKYLPEYYEKKLLTQNEDWELYKGNSRIRMLHEMYDLLLKNVRLSDTIDKGQRIGIYGFGDLGQCLYECFLQEGVEPFIIDKYYETSDNIPIFRINEMPVADLIIVTAMIDYYEIKEELIKIVNADIIALEEFIDNVYRLSEEI